MPLTGPEKSPLTDLLDSLTGYERELTGPGLLVWVKYWKHGGTDCAIMLDVDISVSDGEIGVGFYKSTDGEITGNWILDWMKLEKAERTRQELQAWLAQKEQWVNQQEAKYS